jgi:hypothetical protein
MMILRRIANSKQAFDPPVALDQSLPRPIRCTDPRLFGGCAGGDGLWLAAGLRRMPVTCPFSAEAV